MKRRIEKRGLERFRRYLIEEEREKATVEKYIRDVTRFIEEMGEGEISKQRVMEYKSMLCERYAVSSANSMIASLNCFFRYMGWYELCIKQFRVQRKVFCADDKELSREEYKRLVDVAEQRKNRRLSLIIQTVCSTGIRVSELEYITVEAARRGEATVSCKGKTRTVFIISALRKKLLRYAKENDISSGVIFVTRGGRAINRSNIWREMKGLCKDAGVAPSKVFPHNLRHLFARIFYGVEKDIAKLADILGHSSINTTRIYIITTGAEHRRKMENMRLVM